MSSVRPLRIVLVEDNSADVFLIQESLQLHGLDFELVRFEDGETALGHLCAPPESTPELPDVILLDLHLPGTDGVAILRAIRGDARLAGVPVVVLTGANRKSLERSDLSRACRIVQKSMDLDEYLHSVARAVLDCALVT
jgi:CheY-like chemotaxis protein